MATIIRVIDSVNKVIKIVIGVFAAVMFISVFAQVFCRYVLGFSLSWSEELARYLMVWSVFLGAALALRKQDLIAVEVIAENIPHHIRRILKIIVYLVGIAFFVILFFYGVQMVGNVKLQHSPAMRISMAIPYAGIPVGAVALIMNGVAVILELIMDRKVQSEQGVS